MTVVEGKLVRRRESERMTFVPGGQYRLVGWGRPPEAAVRLDDFFIDKYEVSNREFKEFVAAGGYLKREYWRHPFVKDGREIPWEEATREMRDRTGLPGPRRVERKPAEAKENHRSRKSRGTRRRHTRRSGNA